MGIGIVSDHVPLSPNRFCKKEAQKALKAPRSSSVTDALQQVRQACWRLSPLFHEGAQNFRVINFDHVGSLTAGCGSCRRDTRDDTCACARRIGEGPVCSSRHAASSFRVRVIWTGWDGVRPASVGVVFPKLSKLLNQGDALSAPCIR
jgi:hypothetical protein